jgi:UDP-N-acetylglucosamine--N-acetylmuramyl-(pentapeptide) pyrophosphoryl-undecaprenol N-acetylglucosamine transferase
MKIVFTGGGTGGHFYPIIAVAERVYEYTEERKLIEPEMLYLGPDPFDNEALSAQNITHYFAPAGRIRRYRSPLFIFDFFKTFIGIIRSLFQIFSLYPDVIFSTGGYAAFPTLFAARILNVPVVIYDADAKPGRVSLWSSKFAKFIAVAHPDAASKFPESVRDKIANMGHPIRKVMSFLKLILRCQLFLFWVDLKERKQSTMPFWMRCLFCLKNTMLFIRLD